MNYLDQLAQAQQGFPNNLNQLAGKDMLNLGSFNERQKARLLMELQKRFKGDMSPIERFGHASDVAMAQGDNQF